MIFMNYCTDYKPSLTNSHILKLILNETFFSRTDETNNIILDILKNE